MIPLLIWLGNPLGKINFENFTQKQLKVLLVECFAIIASLFFQNITSKAQQTFGLESLLSLVFLEPLAI